MCSYGKEIFEASQKEQAIAHIFFKKQTKTLFFYKIKSFCCYIDEHLRSRNLGVTERFIYLRDQFFFSKFSFFSGDLEHYLGHCITQEVKCLSDNEGLHLSFMVRTIFCHVVR